MHITITNTHLTVIRFVLCVGMLYSTVQYFGQNRRQRSTELTANNFLATKQAISFSKAVLPHAVSYSAVSFFLYPNFVQNPGFDIFYNKISTPYKHALVVGSKDRSTISQVMKRTGVENKLSSRLELLEKNPVRFICQLKRSKTMTALHYKLHLYWFLKYFTETSGI
jgi:hypothetical protein